jgi:diphosphomevalonate decarboxylase
MMTSSPSYLLMKPQTLAAIHLVRAWREATKHPLYFSLDAGPNLHLLYPEDIIAEVREFIANDLGQYCEGETFLGDWVGEGPEEL